MINACWEKQDRISKVYFHTGPVDHTVHTDSYVFHHTDIHYFDNMRSSSGLGRMHMRIQQRKACTHQYRCPGLASLKMKHVKQNWYTFLENISEDTRESYNHDA